MARSVFWPLALIIAVSGCTERKPPFSAEQFALAKAQCRAVDAYMLKAPANATAVLTIIAVRLNACGTSWPGRTSRP